VVPSLTEVALDGGPDEALLRVPAAAGVGQILGPGGRSLVIGRPANLRRWASSHLGGAKPRKKGTRPPVDLRPVAKSIAFAVATSGFHQRLLFERLMSRHVSPSERRDLKPAAYLHVDLADRFPRIVVRRGLESASLPNLFGPFRDRGAADRARQALEKLHRLRPCDYVFEPEPALPLGLGCMYAQVGSCAAPCLARIGEEEYRTLAARAVALLSSGAARTGAIDTLVRPWVARASAFALVAERGSAGLELYPVSGMAVREEGGVVAAADETLDAAVDRLDWGVEGGPRDDSAWLAAWLQAPRRGGAYLPIHGHPEAEPLARRLDAAGLGTASQR
jgi:excinuclease ABC subunit C